MSESAQHIRFLKRHEIDGVRWDQCIIDAPNGMIYARSFYLDTMAGNWSALVMDDYEMVMPLVWNRKYGIHYLYQPAFTAQLGLFSQQPPDQIMLEIFIGEIKAHFRFCEIHLNFANLMVECPVRNNYVLDLGKPYDEIRKGYKKRLIENLQESSKFGLQYLKTLDYENVIRIFKNEYGRRFPHVKRTDYQHFETLCGLLLNMKMIFVREVKDQTGDLLNASIFFRDERRIYNIMSVTLSAGREKRAHFYLLDQLIFEYSTKDLVLDFEGSELPGIAEFYRKFGTLNQPYPFLKFNNLPFPFRYFK